MSISHTEPLDPLQNLLFESAVRCAFAEAKHSNLQWAILSALDRPDEDHPVILEWLQFRHFMQTNQCAIRNSMARHASRMKELVADALTRGEQAEVAT